MRNLPCLVRFVTLPAILDNENGANLGKDNLVSVGAKPERHHTLGPKIALIISAERVLFSELDPLERENASSLQSEGE